MNIDERLDEVLNISSTPKADPPPKGNLVERLQESLEASVDDSIVALHGRDRVKLLETLLKDRREGQKLELMREQLELTRMQMRLETNPDNPLRLSAGPIGIGRRLGTDVKPNKSN